MKSYPSIETVWIRDPKTNKLNFGEHRTPENTLITQWIITEKIDGTNLRIISTPQGLLIKGRTDNAQMRPDHLEIIKGIAPSREKILECFEPKNPDNFNVTFYGEMYGEGIQKGGNYRKGINFRMFDCLVGTENSWSDYGQLQRIGESLKLDVVPSLGVLYIGDIPKTKEELDKITNSISLVSEKEQGSDMKKIEGIVARPPFPLFDRRGDRIGWKLTYREFNK